MKDGPIYPVLSILREINDFEDHKRIIGSLID